MSRSAIIGCLLVVGCISPLRPAPSMTVPLVVRALEQGSEQPIAQATVWLDGHRVGETTTTGELTIQASASQVITVSVTAEGYRPSLRVSGLLTSDHERWTFYLERP